MLNRADTYEALIERFRWQIPERFNIGVATSDAWARRDPGRAAILEMLPGGDVRQVTYAELAELSDRLAAALAARGIGVGDRIAILLPQCAQTAVAHAAIYKLGAIAVPLALLFGPDALSYRLGDCGARCIITCAQGLETLQDMDARPPALETIVSIDGAGGAMPGCRALDYEALVREQHSGFAPAASGPHDPAMMIYTSGTTGPPKGALHAHRVLLGHLPGVQFPHEFLPQPGDVLWTPADWHGPAACSTSCFRRCISACRSSPRGPRNSTPRAPSR